MPAYFQIFTKTTTVPIVAIVSMIGTLAGFYTEKQFKLFIVIMGGLAFMCLSVIFAVNGLMTGISEGLQATFYALLGFGVAWFVDSRTKKKDYHNNNHKKR